MAMRGKNIRFVGNRNGEPTAFILPPENLWKWIKTKACFTDVAAEAFYADRTKQEEL